MPTDYAKLTVTGLYSKNADYSSPKVSFSPDAVTLTPDEYMHFEVNCDDNGETFDLSMFSGGNVCRPNHCPSWWHFRYS